MLDDALVLLQSLEDEAVTAAIPSLNLTRAAAATAPGPAPADKEAGKPDSSAKAEQGAVSISLM